MSYDSYRSGNRMGICMSLGANLKRLRTSAGMTQGDLSEKSGVRVAHISKLERDDETDPKLSTLTKLMDALRCSAAQLIPDPNDDGLPSYLRSAAAQAANSLSAEEIYQLIMVIDKYLVTSNTRMTNEDIHYYDELENARHHALEAEERDRYLESVETPVTGS